MAFGAPPEVIARAAGKKVRTEHFEVYEENWETLSVFLSLTSQWRIISTMGGVSYQGIEFTSIEPCLRMLGIRKKNRSEVFKSIVLMAAEAASVLNEKMSKNERTR